jgi:hypothetical protein
VSDFFGPPMVLFSHMRVSVNDICRRLWRSGHVRTWSANEEGLVKTPIKGETAWGLEQGANVRTSTASNRGTRLLGALESALTAAKTYSINYHCFAK